MIRKNILAALLLPGLLALAFAEDKASKKDGDDWSEQQIEKLPDSDWNRMEILAIGNRIRFALNGKLVADWTDPKPELCQSGPIGLQLHSNSVPQEIHFRGLILTEDPQEKMVTVDE